VDWKIRDGHHGERPFPLILGIDFAGVVERVAGDVGDFRVGDRIFGAAREHGAFADYTVVPANSSAQPVAKIPNGLSDAEAAALPIAGLTALAAIARLDVPRGDTLLIIGATGAVGSFAVQIAHGRGIHVIATARSGKEELARALGADEVIAFDRTDVVTAVKAAHPGGVAAALDLVSDAEAIKRLAPIVRAGGSVASVIRAADEGWFAERQISATNIAMGQTPQSSRAGLDELVALIAAGTVAVRIDATRPLNDAASVLAAFKSGRLSGNVVLDVAAVGAKR
jgi:NADPH:quinone reductase-like Zn-dependent oxidoreductase